MDDTNALGNQLESGKTQTTKLITDSTGAIVNQLENGQTQTANLLTNGFTSMGNQLADNHTKTANLLTDGINAVGNQTTNLLTNGINAVGNQLVNTQASRDQLYQDLYQQNMREIIQNFMDAIYQGYENLMNQPLKQNVFYLGDRQPEIINTQRFTPQAIEQVNRAAALIEGVENRDNDSTDEWESDDTREDFIAFSSLLARTFNNPDFAQFARGIGFSLLFRAYRHRNENPELMSFFVRVANRKDLTPDYLNYMKDKIKRNAVNVDRNYEHYLQNTYNTIKDMFITQGFNG